MVKHINQVVQIDKAGKAYRGLEKEEAYAVTASHSKFTPNTKLKVKAEYASAENTRSGQAIVKLTCMV